MITLFASGTLSTTGSSTEDSLASCNVQGEFDLHLDINDMAAGDRIRVIAYAIALTGGTKRLLDFADYEGVAPTYHKSVRPFPMLLNDLTDANSIQYTITQTHGTAGISIPWKVLKNDALTPTTTARTVDVDASGGVEVGSFQANAITAAAAAADFGTEIGTAVWATTTRELTALDEDNTTIDLNGTTIGTVTTLTNLPAITANWLTAAGIAADAGAEIADAVWDEVMTGTTTARQTQMLAQATLAGKASGLATATVVYRNIADTTDVISAGCDADGNRTSVTITFP